MDGIPGVCFCTLLLQMSYDHIVQIYFLNIPWTWADASVISFGPNFMLSFSSFCRVSMGFSTSFLCLLCSTSHLFSWISSSHVADIGSCLQSWGVRTLVNVLVLLQWLGFGEFRKSSGEESQSKTLLLRSLDL